MVIIEKGIKWTLILAIVLGLGIPVLFGWFIFSWLAEALR